jgi:hypothetical protein
VSASVPEVKSVITATGLGAAFLADAFVLSAFFKIVRPHDFLDAVEGFSALRYLPGRTRRVASVAAPVAELAVPTLFFASGLAAAGAALAVATSIVFVLLFVTDRRAYIANCGCWLSGPAEAPRLVYVVRNAGFAVVAAATLGGVVASGTTTVFASRGGFLAIGLALPFSLLALETPEIARVLLLKPGPGRQMTEEVVT